MTAAITPFAITHDGAAQAGPPEAMQFRKTTPPRPPCDEEAWARHDLDTRGADHTLNLNLFSPGSHLGKSSKTPCDLLFHQALPFSDKQRFPSACAPDVRP